VIEQRFGSSSPFTVGVEEELMILDAETLALSPSVDVLVRETDDTGLPGVLKTELFASVVELATDTCATVGEAVDSLIALRASAGEIAGRHGLRMAGTGTHPFSPPEEQEIVQEQRYVDFVEYAGPSARRQGVSGLHVHIGMESADSCYQALEGVLPWLPLVLALSANSPYLAGVETGLASNRAEVLAQLPRSGAPPAFGSYQAWEAWIERLVALGVADGYTRFWWDIRPHPNLGTLEIRMPDQPTEVEKTAGFTALLQALCRAVLEREQPEVEPAQRGDYVQNRWAALRFGPKAELIHPDGDRLASVPELCEELLTLVGPAAQELGTTEALGALVPTTCEGERQLEIGRAEGLRAACADLAARTIRSG
jgi:glutamate---cysteine ligase / carboxylate-amine ligase